MTLKDLHAYATRENRIHHVGPGRPWISTCGRNHREPMGMLTTDKLLNLPVQIAGACSLTAFDSTSARTFPTSASEHRASGWTLHSVEDDQGVDLWGLQWRLQGDSTRGFVCGTSHVERIGLVPVEWAEVLPEYSPATFKVTKKNLRVCMCSHRVSMRGDLSTSNYIYGAKIADFTHVLQLQSIPEDYSSLTGSLLSQKFNQPQHINNEP